MKNKKEKEDKIKEDSTFKENLRESSQKIIDEMKHFTPPKEKIKKEENEKKSL